MFRFIKNVSITTFLLFASWVLVMAIFAPLPADAILVTSPPRIIQTGDVTSDNILDGTIIGADISSSASTTMFRLQVSDLTATSTTGTSIFNGDLSLSSLSAGGLGVATGGLVYSVATTTLTLDTGLSYSGTLGSLVGGANGTLSLSGVAPSSLSLTKGYFIVGNDAGTAQATSTIFISSTGNVGIGTTGPGAKLHVIDTTEPLRVGYSATQYSSMVVNSTGDLNFSVIGDEIDYHNTANKTVYLDVGQNNSGISNFRIGQTGGGSSFKLYDTAIVDVQFDTAGYSYINTGNVGIGTTSPGSTLSINGDIFFNGSLRFEDGSSQSVAAVSADVQTFTSNGTYTKPNGAVKIFVQAWGGGGGSGGVNDSATSGGGGGGGYKEKWFDAADVGATEAVTRGAGGTAGAAGNNAGGTGGTTTFGSLLSVIGGSASAGGGTTNSSGGAGAIIGGNNGAGGGAGVAGSAALFGGAGGGGGNAATPGDGGTAIFSGGGGGAGAQTASSAGGTSDAGGAGGAGGNNAAGSAGTQPGGGAGGSGSNGSGTKTGAVGGAGQIIVTTFF